MAAESNYVRNLVDEFSLMAPAPNVDEPLSNALQLVAQCAQMIAEWTQALDKCSEMGWPPNALAWFLFCKMGVWPAREHCFRELETSNALNALPAEYF